MIEHETDYRLIEMTYSMINIENLSLEEARQRNESGWTVPYVGIYRLSEDLLEQAVNIARKRKDDREPGEETWFYHGEMLSENLEGLGVFLVERQRTTYAEAVQTNNSIQGWVLGSGEVQAAIRFTEDGLDSVWDEARKIKIDAQLRSLSCDLTCRYLTSISAEADLDLVFDEIERLNKNGWQIPGTGIYFLESNFRDTMNLAAYVTGRLEDPVPEESRSDIERLKDMGVAIMEGKHLTLKEAKDQNEHGWKVDLGGNSVRLTNDVLEQAWNKAHAREQMPERSPANQPINAIKERSLAYSDSQDR